MCTHPHTHQTTFQTHGPLHAAFPPDSGFHLSTFESLALSFVRVCVYVCVFVEVRKKQGVLKEKLGSIQSILQRYC